MRLICILTTHDHDYEKRKVLFPFYFDCISYPPWLGSVWTSWAALRYPLAYGTALFCCFFLEAYS